MFTHTTRAQFRSQVAARLGDAGLVFWTTDEINRLINEVLRAWNSATLYHRDRGQFQTVTGTTFYDLSTTLLNGSAYLLERTITDADLVAEIKYALIEPTPTDIVTFTEQFSLTDILKAIERRRNQFLIETGQIITTSQQAVSPGDGRIALSDSILDVRRAAWLNYDSSGNPSTYSPLWETDDYALSHRRPRWNIEPGTPDSYTVIAQPQTTLRLAPAPTDIGSLHLLSVTGGLALDGSGIPIGVSQDWCWAIKYGALADLLSKDGQAADPERAQYCEQRYREGVELAKIAASVIGAEVNGVIVPVSDAFRMDAQKPLWQGAKTSDYGEPDTVVMAGLHLVAFSPTPGITTSVSDGKHSIVLDVVRNAIVPTTDNADSTGYIQIDKSYLASLVDFTAHLALFKCGGDEFKASFGEYKAIVELARDYNSRLAANASNFEILKEQGEKEKSDRPMRQVA